MKRSWRSPQRRSMFPRFSSQQWQQLLSKLNGRQLLLLPFWSSIWALIIAAAIPKLLP